MQALTFLWNIILAVFELVKLKHVSLALFLILLLLRILVNVPGPMWSKAFLAELTVENISGEMAALCRLLIAHLLRAFLLLGVIGIAARRCRVNLDSYYMEQWQIVVFRGFCWVSCLYMAATLVQISPTEWIASMRQSQNVMGCIGTLGALVGALNIIRPTC